MAIDPSRFAVVAQLLAAGASHREVQRHTGVNRTLIGRIDRGEYHPREPAQSPLAQVDPYRCDCGHLVVYRPCVICQAHRAALVA